MRQFPNANALIVHEDLPGGDCAEVVKFAKQQRPSMPAVALSISDTFVCDGIDHRCSTHNPDELLQLLRKLFGDPRQLDESNQAEATYRATKISAQIADLKFLCTRRKSVLQLTPDLLSHIQRKQYET